MPDNTTTYTFLSESETATYEASHVTKDVTWPELIVMFLQFLRANGFTMSDSDFFETFQEELAQYNEAIGNDS